MALFSQTTELMAFESVSLMTELEYSEFQQDNCDDEVCDTDSSDTDGCQHCCHCPSCHFTSLLPVRMNLILDFSKTVASVSIQSLQNIHHTTLLRPPQI